MDQLPETSAPQIIVLNDATLEQWEKSLGAAQARLRIARGEVAHWEKMLASARLLMSDAEQEGQASRPPSDAVASTPPLTPGDDS